MGHFLCLVLQRRQMELKQWFFHSEIIHGCENSVGHPRRSGTGQVPMDAWFPKPFVRLGGQASASFLRVCFFQALGEHTCFGFCPPDTWWAPRRAGISEAAPPAQSLLFLTLSSFEYHTDFCHMQAVSVVNTFNYICTYNCNIIMIISPIYVCMHIINPFIYLDLHENLTSWISMGKKVSLTLSRREL